MMMRGVRSTLLLAFVFLTIASSINAATADYYKTLGVKKDCSGADIKKAFRKLALKHHPDKGGSETKFKEISEAYETLSDDSKRPMYDQYGEAGLDPRFSQQQDAGGGGGGGPQSEFFTFFNQQQGQQQQQQGGEGFSFEQFANPPGSSGTHMDIGDLMREMMGGRGDTTRGNRYSPRSSFSSRQQSSSASKKRKVYLRAAPCSLQDLATGVTKKFKVKHPVSVNAWTGEDQVESKVYQVKLKRGWKAGTKIKFPPKDGFPGIIFVVEEKKHPFLERQGDDLVFRCDISKKQAAKGARINIPLPDGEMLVVTVDEDELPIKEGQTLTVPGKGMPIKGGPQRGDLQIVFSIDVGS